jgi:hypothetical protein
MLTAVLLAGGPAGAAPSIRTAPGAWFQVVLNGFAPHATAKLWMIDLPGTSYAQANAGGVLHTRYRAPTAVGHYRLAISGAPRIRSGARPTHPSSNMQVTVPRHAIIPVDVEPRQGHGNEGEQRHHVEGNAGRPAATGADVVAPVVLGAALLLLGLMFAGAGRRRRHERH